eukprot:3163955-Rhodomonas_salina.3
MPTRLFLRLGLTVLAFSSSSHHGVTNSSSHAREGEGNTSGFGKRTLDEIENCFNLQKARQKLARGFCA